MSEDTVCTNCTKRLDSINFVSLYHSQAALRAEQSNMYRLLSDMTVRYRNRHYRPI